MKCPECGAKLKWMVTVGADESNTGLTEELYTCEECGCDWQISSKDVWFFGWRKKYLSIKRKYWG